VAVKKKVKSGKISPKAMERQERKSKIPWKPIGFLIAALIYPLIFRNTYYLDVFVGCWIFVLLALGLNVIVGSAGLLNLGYAAFFAVGAYTYAILNVYFGVPFWIGLIIAPCVCAFAGLLLGFPAIRLRGGLSGHCHSRVWGNYSYCAQ